MRFAVTARRADGTLLGEVNGLPYHYTPADPLWPVVRAVAELRGEALPLEAPPRALVPPPAPPVPTRAELRAQLARIAAQLDALPADAEA